jgi:hypothetical protein
VKDAMKKLWSNLISSPLDLPPRRERKGQTKNSRGTRQNIIKRRVIKSISMSRRKKETRNRKSVPDSN